MGFQGLWAKLKSMNSDVFVQLLFLFNNHVLSPTCHVRSGASVLIMTTYGSYKSSLAEWSANLSTNQDFILSIRGTYTIIKAD